MLTRRKLLAASAGAALSVPLLTRLLDSTAGAATAPTLPLDLVNTTGSATVYAYVLGRDPSAGGNWAFVQSDGRTLYHPPSPSADQTPLGVDCAIALNASGGAARGVTLPHLDSGRIYFSVGAKLTFLMNRGGGLALPSVSNPSDPNIAVRHDFCEFTYNNDQLYANITFVDMVGLPISFRLDTSGATQTVRGLPSDGLSRVAAALRAQSAADGSDWSKLIVPGGGSDLRVLSPNLAIRGNSALFKGYFDDYVNQVWDKYRSTDLRIDTQFTWGTVTGRVSGDQLTFPGVGSFGKPSTLAIFSCSDAPFTTGNDEMGNLSARLAAALNRTTLLDNAFQPTGENPAAFYTRRAPTTTPGSCTRPPRTASGTPSRTTTCTRPRWTSRARCSRAHPPGSPSPSAARRAAPAPPRRPRPPPPRPAGRGPSAPSRPRPSAPSRAPRWRPARTRAAARTSAGWPTATG